MAILHCGILGQAKLHVSWTMHGINRNFCHGVTDMEWRVFTFTIIYRNNNVLCINPLNVDWKRYSMRTSSFQRKVAYSFHFVEMIRHGVTTLELRSLIFPMKNGFTLSISLIKHLSHPWMRGQLWYFSMDVMLFEYYS